ncbi:sugar transferase [Thermophilibacter sp.]
MSGRVSASSGAACGEGCGPAAVEDDVTAVAAERLRNGRLGYRAVKRAFDVAFSACALVCLSWLFLIVVIAIKLDDPEGPAIFRQVRVGRDGREFVMYKFRSMRADAEERLAELQAMNEKDGPVFKIADDPRVTRVGRVIRKTSIDELPQFVNILKGDLSVVGPRPALPNEVAEYTPRQLQRLSVKQGITCYWQTRRNRDAIPFDEWVDLDLLYVRQCSVWTDLKLIVQTVGVVLTAQGS